MQKPSDCFFERPLIYFGSFEATNEREKEIEEAVENFYPFILEIDPKHPLHQDTGLYFQWTFYEAF